MFTYRQVAYGYGKYLQKQKPNQPLKVIIINDNRLNGREYALVCGEVLAELGIQVYLPPANKLLATPIISYLIRQMGADGGINITASHNPKAYNGFKVYNSQGIQVNDHQANAIVRLIPAHKEVFGVKYLSSTKLIQSLKADCDQQYFQLIANCLPTINLFTAKKLKVAFSPHHGVTCQQMARFCHQLGFVNFLEYPLEATITGNYSDEEITNPEDFRSFDPLIHFAKQQGSKYLFAADPDGDRCAFGEQQPDGSFYFFNGNEHGILLTNYLLNNLPSGSRDYYLVSSYVTNNFVDKLAEERQIPVFRTATGFKNISRVVENENQQGKKLLIAFEEAIGSLLFDFHREKDAYQATALTLTMINHYHDQKLLLTTVLDQLYQKYGY